MSIADSVKRAETTLEQRGLPSTSYWQVTLEDGSILSEVQALWLSFSEIRTVDFFGEKKSIYVSKLPISEITVFHDGLKATIAVPKDHEVYQAIRSEATLSSSSNTNQVIGRCLGIIKGGVVVEEQLIDIRMRKIFGAKK